MKRLLLAGLMTIVASAGVATSAFAQQEAEWLHLSWGLHYSEASPTAIPKEEARQIGVNALAKFFDVDLSQLGNYSLEMNYMPYGSTWSGTIRVPHDRQPCPDGLMLRGSDLFRFRLDAQTGELLGLQFFPSECPIARPNMQNDCMGTVLQVFEYRDNMTAQHNIEFSRHAMQVAEQLNIFEGDILRAAISAGGWMMGRDNSFELVVSVTVESTHGELIALRFQGASRKELVDVEFFANSINVTNWINR